MKKRKICVLTGSRAEYGLLYWLMKEIAADKALELQVFVTGTHLSPNYGSTYKLIEEDGFRITQKIKMPLENDTPFAIAGSMSQGLTGFVAALERFKPDIFVMLGDRYEVLIAAVAAMLCRVPIAHLCGGETTEGVIDEAIRHSITKMAHMHFVASRTYAKRIRQLGEGPKRIFNFGDPGLDHIRRLHLLSKQQLEKEIGFTLGSPTFLITYHPVTLKPGNAAHSTAELLNALCHFPNAKMIFTKANADMEGRIINRMIEKFVRKHYDRCVLFSSLGPKKYLSAMKYADVVIGNSSSGIVESPMFKKPTVNIGERQRGRLKAASILDCPEDKKKIVAAIRKALSPGFQRRLSRTVSLHGVGDTAFLIKEQLKKHPLDGILMKHFYDLPETGGWS